MPAQQWLMEFYDQAAEVIAPIESRLRAEMDRALGPDWCQRWFEGLPHYVNVPGEVNISEITEDIFSSFRPLAEQKNLSFTMSAPAKKLYACIDTDAFNKILTNLLSNAVKYAKTKVELHLLPLFNGTNTFSIEVKNDGYLIPMEMKEKIFEPFFRLKETEKQKGTGIGLALSLSLTELHKGALSLKEPENNMNVFSVSIPLRQDT